MKIIIKLFYLYTDKVQIDSFEIEVFELNRIMDLRHLIENHRQIDDIYFLFFKYFILRYKDIILNESNFIEYYKIAEGDEICVGRPEHILVKDEIIIDVLMVRAVDELIHLIMRRSAKIGEIRSVLNQITGGSANGNIWNSGGCLLEDHDEVSCVICIGGSQYLKIICSDVARSFDECRKIHDEHLLEKYFWGYMWRFWDDWDNELFMTSQMKDQLYRFGQRVLGIVRADTRLAQFLQGMPVAFRDSAFLFCSAVVDGVYRVLRDCLMSDWEHHQATYAGSALGLFQCLFYVATRVAILKIPFSIGQEASALCKVVEVVVQYFQDPNMIEKDFEDFFCSYFLLRPLDVWIPPNNSAWSRSHGAIKLSIRGSLFAWMKLPKYIQTVFQAKVAISSQIGVVPEDLFLIRCDADCEPEDGEKYEINKENFDTYLFEILCSTDDYNKSRLDVGAQGVVLLCTHKKTNEEFVMKKSEGELLYKSIRTHANISGLPNIPRFKGLYKDKGVICLAMEYFPRGSLSDHIKERGFLPESEIAGICYQILLQIIDLHRNRCIHRDIKCKNIVFDKDFKAKLVDFDSSESQLDSLPGTLFPPLNSEPPGTTTYMAPEVLNGESYSNKIDIWSLGVVALELKLGERPYPKLGLPQYIFQIGCHRKIEYHLDNSLSPEFQGFLDCCLEGDVKKRATAEQLIQTRFIKDYLHETRS